MDALTEFVLAFLFTVFSLLGVLWTGFRWRIKKRRKLHLGFVGLSVGCLLWTIFVALQLGELYDLESAGSIYPVHMVFAQVATFSLALPVVTGAITLRTGKSHRYHRMGAVVSFTLILIAAITGIWMILAATPFPIAG